jgi:hypothetical protein
MGDIEKKLLQEAWINYAQLTKAKEEQKNTNKSLFSTLIKMGFLTEEDVYMFFAQATGIPFVRLSDYKLDLSLVELFSEEFYRENLLFPLFKVNNTLYVCMANPLNTELINTIRMQTNSDIYPLFSYPSSIIETINKFFGPDDKYFNLEDLILAPQTLNMVPFWRESERLSLNLPLEFKPIDPKVKLISPSYISATAQDISSSGKAMGIQTFIFLPPQVRIVIRFPTKDPGYEAKAQVVRCDMQKGGSYFLGIKFLEVGKDLIESILEEAKPS